MAQNNLISAAAQAGLNSSQKAQVDGLAKLLDSHKTLLALPAPVAQQKFGQMTQDQQNAHLAMFGESEDAPPEQKRGWFGTAFHYVTTPIKAVIGGTFAALTEVSDAMTRIYRTGAIALDQNVNIAKAFEIANDKGDMVFSPDRISRAKKEFGNEKNKLVIQNLGIIVFDFLEKHFGDIFNYEYTKKLEDELDAIAEGKKTKIEVCEGYYKQIISLKEKLLTVKLKEREKQESIPIPIDSNHSFIIGKYGPVIKCIDEKNKISFKAIKKDIDISRIQEYSLEEFEEFNRLTSELSSDLNSLFL